MARTCESEHFGSVWAAVNDGRECPSIFIPPQHPPRPDSSDHVGKLLRLFSYSFLSQVQMHSGDRVGTVLTP